MNVSNRFFTIKTPSSVMKALISSWYYFLVFIGVALAIGYYTAYKKQDVYQSVTEILISGNTESNSNLSSYQGLAGYEAYATISNQKRVLQSYDLLAEVVNKLNWEYSIYQEGRLRTVELYPSAPFEILHFERKNTIVSPQFKVKYSDATTQLMVFSGGEEVVFEYPPNALYFNNELVSIKLKSSSNNLRGDYYIVKRGEKLNVSQLRRSIVLSDFEYTSFIKISYNDFNATRAKDVLDTLVASYIDYNVRAKYLLNDKTLDFIDKQINEVTRYISQGEFDLESYKAKESIIDLNSEEQRYLNKMVDYDEKIRSWNLQINTLEELMVFLKANKSASLMPPLLYMPSNEEYITKMLNQMYDLEFGEQRMDGSRTDNNPQFDTKNENVKSIRSELLLYLNETKGAILKEMEFLKGELGSFEAILRSIPKDQREIINYQRKIQVNEKLYNFLLEKRAGVIIERSTISSAAEVVEKPRLLGRIGPDRSAIRTSYLLYGFLLALLAVAIRFFFFQKFKNIEDFKEWSDLPVLAGVSTFKSDLVPNSSTYPNSEIAEQYRRIRANLQYVDSKHQSILLTSMFPSEGKTHNAIHIAALKGLGDKRTVLLDLDLHKPSVHTKLNITNDVGMSSLLSGAENDFKSVRQTVFKNFDVIPSGKRPPNPSELILSDRTEELIRQLRNEYDIIVIDTPPLHLITDAKELQKYSDVNVLVLNTKNATRQTVIDIEDYVAAYTPKNFSLILNGIKQNNLLYKYGGKRYKYAYKYGYGYGSYGYGGYGDRNRT
jgi:capsular exopolysaccharide synthesis family protein